MKSYLRIVGQGSYFTNRLAVGSIALPVARYVKCHYHQKNEKAVCREESNSVFIVLGCVFLVWWPIERAMFYFAHQYVRNPTQ